MNGVVPPCAAHASSTRLAGPLYDLLATLSIPTSPAAGARLA